MRFLELLVMDCLTDGPQVTRTEWIHRDHIESVEAYLIEGERDPMLWLELTLTSGRARYLPVGPLTGSSIEVAAAHAIAALLEREAGPVAAAR